MVAHHICSLSCAVCVSISQRAERRKQRNFDADYCSTNFVILAELQILEEIIRSNAGRDASERELAREPVVTQPTAGQCLSVGGRSSRKN